MSDVAVLRGRIPTVDSLSKKIARIKRILVRAEKLSQLLPGLEDKLRIVSDPNFVKLSESKKIESLEHKANRAAALLSTLPANVVAAIMAKLGK